MKRTFRLRVLALLLTLAVGIGISGGARLLHAQGTPQGLSLQSVTTRTLAASGITLSDAGANPAVSADDAQRTALRYFAGSQVRERMLVRFQDSHVRPAIDVMAWVVSIVPPGGIFSTGHRIQGSYDLIIIDAQSGVFLLGVSGGEVK